MKSGMLPDDEFVELIGRAVRKILSFQSLDEFIAWFRGELARQSVTGAIDLDAQGAHMLGAVLGRAIWGATPAPHNDFRPRPLPEPGRNEPCVCGSGVKFKRCCGGGPRMPALKSDELWPIVLEELPPRGRKAAVDSGRVPVPGLAQLGLQAIGEGRPKFAVDLLEPLFDERFAGVDERYDHALTVLLDAYEDLGWHRKKQSLLERAAAEAPRSPLRSGALQRLAAIASDSGDGELAWKRFRQAQQDDPDVPSLGLLEVQLLVAEQRIAEARERARFWRRRLQRIGDPGLEQSIEFLSRIIENPQAALAGFMMEAHDGAGQSLQALLADLAAREVPAYRWLPAAEIPALERDDEMLNSFVSRLRGMGVPADDAEAMSRDLFAELQAGGLDFEDSELDSELDDPAPGDIAQWDPELDESEEESFPALQDPAAEDGFRLLPPDALATIEADWHAIYPVAKPFSIQPVPYTEAEPWAPGVERLWTAFLKRHPEAFDSIDILDDLASAIALHPAGDMPGFDVTLLKPLLDRVERILNRALAAPDAPAEPRLPWIDVVNRPVLRCIFRGWVLAAEQGDTVRERALAERLILLNPADNHGVRAYLLNLLLREGDDEAALALASQYGEDMLPETLYGSVLALVRLGRGQEAAAVAQRAVNAFPEVRRYLVRERAAKPKLDPLGVRYGGKDQAWLYREAMRDTWLQHPDALELVRKSHPG